jgi:hypothetical protein
LWAVRAAPFGTTPAPMVSDFGSRWGIAALRPRRPVTAGIGIDWLEQIQRVGHLAGVIPPPTSKPNRETHDQDAR